MAQLLNGFWQPKTHSLKLIVLISCLLTHPLHPLPLILWYHHWDLDFLHQACRLLVPSHHQCHLLERSHLEYRQPCPHHLCLLGLEDMVPHQQEPQEPDIQVMDIHILTLSHQLGCPIQGCLRCSWPTMAPMA